MQFGDFRKLPKSYSLVGKANITANWMIRHPTHPPKNPTPTEEGQIFAFLNQNRFLDGLAAAEQMVARIPNHQFGWAALGVFCDRLGLHDKSLNAHLAAMLLEPENAVHYCNFAICINLISLIDASVAERALLCAIQLNPHLQGAYSELALVYIQREAETDSYSAAVRALALHPSGFRDTYHLGRTLHLFGRSAFATRILERSTFIDPHSAAAHHNWSLELLSNGNFADGLAENEWRRQTIDFRDDYPKLQLPYWSGQHGGGENILIYAEQGFGDTIQFCRYLKLVAQRGFRVWLKVQPSLSALLSDLEGVDQIILGDVVEGHFAYHCALLSLPFIFGTRLESIPNDVPYIGRSLVRLVCSRGRPRIGLVWRGNPKPNIKRTIGAARLASLCQKIDAQWVSLQIDATDEELASIPNIEHSLKPNFTWRETAEKLLTTDLVVTIDTGIAHLSGAMGHETLVMLPYVADWRWMKKRSDSPWYPSMKLFRQISPGDWQPVLDEIEAVLLAAGQAPDRN